MKIKLLFAWYDLWVGFFYDRGKNWLYFLPFPMVGIILKLPQKRYWLVSNYSGAIIGSTNKEDLEYCLKQDNIHGRRYWAINGTTVPVFGKNHIQE